MTMTASATLLAQLLPYVSLDRLQSCVNIVSERTQQQVGPHMFGSLLAIESNLLVIEHSYVAMLLVHTCGMFRHPLCIACYGSMHFSPVHALV